MLGESCPPQRVQQTVGESAQAQPQEDSSKHLTRPGVWMLVPVLSSWEHTASLRGAPEPCSPTCFMWE